MAIARSLVYLFASLGLFSAFYPVYADVGAVLLDEGIGIGGVPEDLSVDETVRFMNKGCLLQSASAKASSTLAASDGLTYRAQNAIDGWTKVFKHGEWDLGFPNETAWVEGVPGSGVGEWLEITLPRETFIKRLSISPGYYKSKESLYDNNRVKDARLSFFCPNGHGGSVEKIVNVHFNPAQWTGKGIASYLLDCGFSVRSIRFTILSVYKGNKYNDTCISDISSYAGY